MNQYILFTEEYLRIINDNRNIHNDVDEIDSTNDKTMDLYDDCRLIIGYLMCCIGICSIFIIHQWIYCLLIAKH